MHPLLTTLQTPAGIASALVVVNAAAFTAFGFDKLRAEAGRWRVAESTLLLLALIGGTIGAYAGRAAFRHKTRKQPFSAQLHTIAALQVAAPSTGSGLGRRVDRLGRDLGAGGLFAGFRPAALLIDFTRRHEDVALGGGRRFALADAVAA